MPTLYVASRSPHPGMAVLDQYIFLKYVGMVEGVDDTLLKLWGLRAATPTIIH
jgi:hypothetical protein